jgi:aminoglycoside phosphotransferase (APT) family kinase protein
LGASLIANEIRALPVIAPHLPLPIPVPLYAGQPDTDCPYPFAGYAMLPGETACVRSWTDEERGKNAEPLARFLAALHSIPVDAETLAWAPRDEIQRADHRRRADTVRERLRAIAATAPDLDVERLLKRIDGLETAPAHSGPPCWVHGDLYPRHLRVGAAGLVQAVIDWGDVHLGDPALDLSIAFTFLSEAARVLFAANYGPVAQATWERAQFRAIHYGAILLEYGHETGDQPIRALGEFALRNASA